MRGMAPNWDDDKVMKSHAIRVREGDFVCAKMWWHELMLRRNPSAIRHMAKKYVVGNYGLLVLD